MSVVFTSDQPFLVSAYKLGGLIDKIKWGRFYTDLTNGAQREKKYPTH